MKNISLHAPLNDTNRNWERALIKKANSGGSSLKKGDYAFTVHGISEEGIAQLPDTPELIAIDTTEYSLYHIEETTPNESSSASALGLVVLHDYNDLTLVIQINDTTGSSNVKIAHALTDNGNNYNNIMPILGNITFVAGSHWAPSDGQLETQGPTITPYTYIQDNAFNETLYDAIVDFLSYEFPIER